MGVRCGALAGSYFIGAKRQAIFPGAHAPGVPFYFFPEKSAGLEGCGRRGVGQAVDFYGFFPLLIMIEAIPAAENVKQTYPAPGQKSESLLPYTGRHLSLYSVAP